MWGPVHCTAVKYCCEIKIKVFFVFKLRWCSAFKQIYQDFSWKKKLNITTVYFLQLLNYKLTRAATSVGVRWVRGEPVRIKEQYEFHYLYDVFLLMIKNGTEYRVVKGHYVRCDDLKENTQLYFTWFYD
jgi:hypothetical protein